MATTTLVDKKERIDRYAAVSEAILDFCPTAKETLPQCLLNNLKDDFEFIKESEQLSNTLPEEFNKIALEMVENAYKILSLK